MRFRGKSIRRKIVALLLVPLLSLTGLWGFTTVLTGREAGRLLDVNQVVDAVGEPVTDAVAALQQERRHTLVYLADRRSSGALTALRDQRTAVDRAVAAVRAGAAGDEVRDTLRSDGDRKLTALLKGFDGLTGLRRSVEAGTVSRARAMAYYNGVIDPAFPFLNSLHTLSDIGMERQGRAVVGLVRAVETVAREDALIAAALTSGRVTPAERRALTGLVARRELLYETSLESLPGKEREVYHALWNGPKTLPLRDAEQRLTVTGPEPGTAASETAPSETAEWREAVAPVIGELRREAVASEDRHEDQVEPAAYNVFLKAGIAGVLGFLALLVSVVVSVRIGRELVRDLSRLRREAHEVSGVRLPGVMRRLAAGEPVDVETEAPRLDYPEDEIGQAGRALNTLQRAAVEAAVRQSEMRRGVSEVFVNLARRNQVLLHRQLTLLDAMERRTEDADELADLFRLDHLTTRMRRHAEGLVILSGAAPSRQWRKPVQLMDVVRAAVAEVEDYERIEIRRLPRIGVGGQSVADLTHLIAELLENATVFSPPDTAVQVHGERVANGFTLEIHDRGLGMQPEALLEANLRLAETPEFELSDTDRLGLFVISRLAQRQNVRVSLQASPYGGTTAVVFLPAALLTDAPEERESGFRLDRTTQGAADRRTRSGPPPAAVGGVGVAGRSRSALPRGSDTPGDRFTGPDSGPGPDRPDRSGGGFGPADGALAASFGLPGDGYDPAHPGGPDSAFPGGGYGPAQPTDPYRTTDPYRSPPGRPDAYRERPGGDQGPAGREEHQQAGEPAADGTPAPLPRRRKSPGPSPIGRGPGGAGPPGPAGPRRGLLPGGGAEPPTGGHRRADEMPGGPLAPGAVPAFVDGLPRRIRQASLAPQLRDARARTRGRAPAPYDTPDRTRRPGTERDADSVRDRMASLQRGWQRGRRENDTPDNTDTAADTTADHFAADNDVRSSATGRTGRPEPRTTSEGNGP
ncbi:nitrate- and nitrite sensing domain-containing protein [Streptomyces sp. NPDC006798]|uniref:nitrate- and nitrite sensing domain-containing protein n=1 Tax=Streptomyces sp. NPDC006798 TaxID=3155462 RepID=UPI0033F19A70